MNTLDYILKPVSSELAEVDENLAQQLSRIAEDHTRINPYSRLSDRAIGHLFKAHGKLLRPALFLLSARAVGAVAPRAVGAVAPSAVAPSAVAPSTTPSAVAPSAVASSAATGDALRETLVQVASSIELIHSASLIHDDVIDESMFRRGRMSVNERYGNKIAVLAGDILYTQFYSIVGTLAGVGPEMKLKLLELFTGVTRRMCFGEIYEERMRARKKPPEFADYLDTIANKTASLMSACCEAGAIVAEADVQTVQLLRDFGHNLGMAYQLFDDLSDRDAVFLDAGPIAEAAAAHVSSTLLKLEQLPNNAFSERLRAIVDSVYAGQKSEPAAQRV
ncbi:MAG TPA: polyprenyl synthetase family protein [Spirochaetia bacterium]|nr:polyprenyl synthetase family protein [Spirochaetia bacterium]